MKFLSCSLGAVLLLSVPALHAATSDDMLIYSDRFNNGSGYTAIATKASVTVTNAGLANGTVFFRLLRHQG